MLYLNLGKTGLQVSRICVGGMSFGEPHRGRHTWTLDEEHSRQVIGRALDNGINFFDTANVYSAGSSEEITGRTLLSMTHRDNVVIATKVFHTMRPGPNGGGLSRKAIMSEVDNSLRRLGTDYIDLYQIHRLDSATPMEETLEALHDVVKAGKARYIGACSMWAWQFAKALFLADLNGWTRFVSMQNHYNLIYREDERELIPLCLDQNIALNPYSPLARGLLAQSPDETSSARAGSDAVSTDMYDDAQTRPVEGLIAAIAAQRGVTRAEVALAWVLSKPGVVAPIVGVDHPGHLDTAVAALDLGLTTDDVAQLESAYQPKKRWSYK